MQNVHTIGTYCGSGAPVVPPTKETIHIQRRHIKVYNKTKSYLRVNYEGLNR